MLLTLHTKLFIDSAHYIKNYKGNCKNIHGHTWLIELWFKGDSTYKNKLGILVDFKIVNLIKDRLDHQFLNHILNFNPTAENLTEYLYNSIKKIIHKKVELKVRVYENIDKQNYCESGDF